MSQALRCPSDVIVVGGSAAGLFTATVLAKAGARVRVFDASDPHDQAPRTLIVTPRLHEFLGVPDGAIVNRIARMDLFSPEAAATVPLGEPDLVVERAAVIRLLAEQALEAGAEIVKGARLVNVDPLCHL